IQPEAPSLDGGAHLQIFPLASPHPLTLLVHLQGVRMPTLGSFDTVCKCIWVGAEAVTIQKPVFYLAGNLAVAHNLMDSKAYLPGNKELEPLKYSEVAMDAAVSWQKVEGCIQGTMSLLPHCLGKGQNIALILKEVG
ncbi:CCD81 protein, partial [Ibidorhyncha struthersii]|nr:CCD81 protein [Ibidorhyncha struthersii]